MLDNDLTRRIRDLCALAERAHYRSSGHAVSLRPYTDPLTGEVSGWFAGVTFNQSAGGLADAGEFFGHTLWDALDRVEARLEDDLTRDVP